MEVAVLLGGVFVALVVLAIWFGQRNQPSKAKSTVPVPARTDPVVPAVAKAAKPEVVDGAATGKPATERDEENRPTTVFQAAATGHVRGLRDLLDANPLVSRLEQLDERGWTALHHAAYHDQIPCIRLLIERNANVDAVAEGECVPLHMAAAQGSVEAVQLLLDAGTDVDTPDDAGATALHYAALPGRLEVVEALLAAGAQVNMKNGRQETALDLAVRLADASVADVLRKADAVSGADVKMSDILPLLGDRAAAKRVPSTWHLDADGPELAAARTAAQDSLPKLLAHLADHPDTPIALKFAITEGPVVEHVWGEAIEPGPPFVVRLSAPPVAVAAPEEPVTVELDEIVDWQARLSDGRRAGGYSQRATYEAIRAEYGFLPPNLTTELDKLVDI